MMKTIIITAFILGNAIVCLAQENFENDNTDVHAGLYSGAWIPTAKLSDVGTHPFIGLQMNIRHKKMHYQMFFDFRLLSSKSDYDFYYRYDDTLITTNNFFSGQYGLAVGREIVKRKNNTLLLKASIASDFIKAMDEPDSKKAYYYYAPIASMEEEDKDKYMNTYNVGFGLLDRINFENGNYFEVGANYHFVDYTLKNKSSLEGNVLSLNISYNFMLR